MSLANTITAINASAKKVYGSDIRILVARAVAFGNDDNLVIVSGKNHRAVAADLVRSTPGAKVSEEHHPEMNWGDGDVRQAYTTSVVTF
ncbi:hypothetical protein Q8O96_30915 [Pseudomonas sp. LPH60]|uniref:hypothetical protein n=1 Tax=Pseudomonas sp. LPH60 TaxID=3065906 RepID=UPI00273C620C|nr:hypothetical protein [Pseudomonas sp. LPH60]MDP4573485.1 hypothetical protein [Pseudomonas sp. LPH60]